MTAQILETQTINEQELEAINGGGTGATLGWAFANIPTLGIPMIVDAFKGGNVTKYMQDV